MPSHLGAQGWQSDVHAPLEKRFLYVPFLILSMNYLQGL